MSILDKPAVDTDISHLDFPTEEPVCANDECSAVATQRLAVSCGCVHLLCQAHIDSLMEAMRKLHVTVGHCKCGAVSSIVSITPIRGMS